MTNRHLMIVGLLALVAAALVGLNWTSVGGTADRETKQEQVAVKTEKPAKKAEEERSSLHDEMQKRCEKLVAKHVPDDVGKEDIQDACACAADDIQAEFEDELPDIIKTGSADPKTEERMDAIINACVQSAGLDFQ